MRTRAAQGLTQFLATYPIGIETDKATENDPYAAPDAYCSSDHDNDPIVVVLDMPGGHLGIFAVALLGMIAFNRKSLRSIKGISKNSIMSHNVNGWHVDAAYFYLIYWCWVDAGLLSS
jgi:hypothetical protein